MTQDEIFIAVQDTLDDYYRLAAPVALQRQIDLIKAQHNAEGQLRFARTLPDYDHTREWDDAPQSGDIESDNARCFACMLIGTGAGLSLAVVVWLSFF